MVQLFLPSASRGKETVREVAASRGTTNSALSTCKPTPGTTRLSAPMHSRWKNTRVLMAAGGAVAAGTVQSKVCTVQFVRRNTCHASRGGQRFGERDDESGQLCWAVASGRRGGVVGLTSSSNSHSPFEPIEMTTHGGRCWLSPHARFSPSPRPYVSRGVAAARGAEETGVHAELGGRGGRKDRGGGTHRRRDRLAPACGIADATRAVPGRARAGGYAGGV